MPVGHHISEVATSPKMQQRRLSQNNAANKAAAKHTTKLHLQAYARLREESAAASDEDRSGMASLHVG